MKSKAEFTKKVHVGGKETYVYHAFDLNIFSKILQLNF